MSTAPVLSSHDQDEIDLQQLFAILWKGRVKIILTTVIFAVLSVLYALSLPDRYKVSVILAPAQSDGGGGGLAAQYGGLASLAGINLSAGGSNRLEQAVEVLTHWPFLDGFVQRHQLVPYIMAVEEWDKKTKQLVFNEDIYDTTNNKWIQQEPDKDPVPTSYQVYERFSKMISVVLDKKSGFMTLEVEYFSPDMAYQWMNWLITDLNEHFRMIDINEAKKNIEYLKAKVQETPITEMQTVFYNLIESQTKSLMLAEVSEQYLVKTIVPSMVPEKKSAPKRAFICVIGSILGIIIGMFLTLWPVFIQNTRKTSV